jgi:uncharacterized protein
VRRARRQFAVVCQRESPAGPIAARAGGEGQATTREGRDGSICAKLARMAIHPDLLEILACPVCKTPVEVVKDGAGLRCGQCKRVYPVRDDIPIMLPEEATVEG